MHIIKPLQHLGSVSIGDPMAQTNGDSVNMESTFRPPEKFVFEGSNVDQRWVKWKRAFEIYFTAAEIEKKAPKVQIAILLHAAGSEAQVIHSQFVFAEETDKDDIKKVLEMFDAYCRPRKNIVYERYRFWSRGQLEDEPIDTWVKELKTISTNCEFKDEDDMLRDKIVFGYRDTKVKERMIRETSLDLKKTLQICRAAESTKNQMKTMNNSTERNRDVNTIMNQRDNRSISHNNNGNNTYNNNTSRQEHYRPTITCFNCNRTGHFSRDCPNGDNFPRGRRRGRGRGRGRSRGNSNRGNFRSTRGNHNHFHEIEEEFEDDSEFIYTIVVKYPC